MARQVRNKAYRAGKRICSRCKGVFNKKKGVKHLLCSGCLSKCARCNTELTGDNTYGSSNRTGRKGKRYNCATCDKEITTLTRKPYSRDRHLVKTYGITINEYDYILKRQGGVCWICEERPKEGGRKLSVDHEHVKKDKKQNPRNTRTRVRGLLCWTCNGSIAKFKDDPIILRRAADYLDEWPAQVVLKEK